MHIPVHRNSKGHNNLLGHSNPHLFSRCWHSLFSYRMERGIIMGELKHYDVIHSEWITVKAKSEEEAYKKAEKTITKMITEGSAPDFEDGLHDMFISDVREEE